MRPMFAVLILFAIANVSGAQTLGTCHIFPSNNPWNERIDTLPVHPRSAQFIASVGGTIHVHPDFGSNALYGIPWVAVNNSQPPVKVTITSGWGQEDPGPMPIPANAPVENPPPPNGDAHVLVVDTSDHHLYELYQGIKDNSGTGWTATTSAKFALDSNNFRPDGWTSCDAAGLPIWPGLVRQYECKAGEIKHALRFTIPHSSRGYIFPARHFASSNTDTTSVMPMGLRLRLKASYDDSRDTGNAKVIVTALKRYGIILADNGSSWYISGETNTGWDDNDISQLRAITGNDFEVVYTGPIAVDSGQFPTPVIPIPGSVTGLTAPAFAYDTVLAGTSNAFPVVLHNSGVATVNMNLIKVKSGLAFAMTSTPPTSIAPNASAIVMIRFSPTISGQIVDTLTIKSDDATNPAIKVPLMGFGSSGVFHVSTSPFRFGRVALGQPDTMLFSFGNTGTGRLSVDVSNTNGTNPDFTILTVQPPVPPPFLLQPGDSIQAVVQFIPSKAGFDTTSFMLSISDYVGESHDTTVSIIGEGIVSTSVAAPLPLLGIRIYPNPTQGILRITSDAVGTASVDVTDALGRSVYRGRLSASGTLDLSSLPNGSYFVHLKTPGGQASQHIELLR
ncbi:MAG: choice-of-anchor D domain-containing protein [Bacteroidota bacterium]|nr:choice-of-anchor D domain-containing protein [Bacteroidota bacterium]MDP4232319.1 choice-of-anchor D domain-containing protein [Bacteroidota bacterium]MDP4241458.1 choice-of-anchor D domain-containing protein [Bacteroidota bacterium]MDP4286718.1 choice-of-anchor D domain-containing protein [Bacteroidota bacterium]